MLIFFLAAGMLFASVMRQDLSRPRGGLVAYLQVLLIEIFSSADAAQCSAIYGKVFSRDPINFPTTALNPSYFFIFSPLNIFRPISLSAESAGDMVSSKYLTISRSKKIKTVWNFLVSQFQSLNFLLLGPNL